MSRYALTLSVALAALVAGCGKPAAPAASPIPAHVPTSPSLPEQSGKKHIDNIPALAIEDVKRYYGECMAFKDIGDPRVPYFIEDCRAIRARWDRRDMATTSKAKSAPNLPQLK